jgi:plastocyanin
MNSPANQHHLKIPMADAPPGSRWALTVAFVLALAVAACSSGSAAVTLAPASSAPSTAAGAPSASASSSASGAGIATADLQISAQGIQFSTKQLQAPAGKAFGITFVNNDSGIQHNINILDANNASVFKGAIFAGVATQTYQVPALKAGTYGFICDVHPTIMTGTLTVR